MRLTLELSQSPLFQLRPESLSVEERIRLTYQRAQDIGRTYALTAKDVLLLTPKFWDLHSDPIFAMDGAAGALLTLQYNCCAGTLAMFAKEQPSLYKPLQQILNYDVSGQFCLTEVGHGLDVIHMETTAILLPSGEIELNTPNEYAAKFMPSTSPIGMACIAIVFARAIIEGEDRGIKPFLVPLHDGKNMYPGITSKLLPQRGGSRPLNHSLTYFHNVRLPFSALLGTPNKPTDARAAFFKNISRVAIGTIAISCFGISSLKVSSTIAARYSMRRTIVDSAGKLRPIMSFRTQKIPILTALAQSFVLEAMHDNAVVLFRDMSLDPRVRHAVAAIVKVTIMSRAQAANLVLGDRCGSQGLFQVNQITAIHADIRGAAIAEGDLLGISIRFASELLLGKYTLPATTNPTSLLAQHEAGLFKELRALISIMPHHYSPAFDRSILPECTNLIQAIGHRMAYDAAIARGMDPALIELYVASCIKLDSAWYVENINAAAGAGISGLSRMEQREMEGKAVDRVYERMEEFLGRMDVEHVITAPCVTEEAWKEYVEGLETFTGPLDPDESPLDAVINVPGTGGGEEKMGDRFEELRVGEKINGRNGYANVGSDTVTV